MVTAQTDIERIAEQERALVFAGFDEATAFALGCAVRAQAEARGHGVVVDVRLWDRPLFYCALPGTTADNVEWVRRKINMVKRFGKSSYRLALEWRAAGRAIGVQHGLEPMDYVLAGGSFPIRLKSIGIVGAVTVSGVPERDDHGLVVAGLNIVQGRAPDAFGLPPEQGQA
jgi:uncharacterized protein (UPF0303 family)